MADKTIKEVQFNFDKLDLDEQLALLTLRDDASAQEMQEIFRIARRVAVGGLGGVKATLPELISHLYEQFGAYSNPKAETSPSETA